MEDSTTRAPDAVGGQTGSAEHRLDVLLGQIRAGSSGEAIADELDGLVDQMISDALGAATARRVDELEVAMAGIAALAAATAERGG